MRTCFLLGIMLFCTIKAFSQNKAAFINSSLQYFKCGNVSITGKHLTVEALIKSNGSGWYNDFRGFDIVSKHDGPYDNNYLLRREHGELSTTTGSYSTTFNNTSITSFSRDSFYHIAMTYDGAYLKFYVNGCLYSQVQATGDLLTNNYQTTIAQKASGNYDEHFYGFIDEVRIWSVTRSESEIKNNMLDLPNPSAQTGLLAYYKFEGNSKNIQGNTAYDAVAFGGAAIVQQDNFTKIKPFSTTFSYQEPTCSENDGSIIVNAIGGKPPYAYSLNGRSYQHNNTFTGLTPGNYTVSVKSDGTGCVQSHNLILNSPAPKILVDSVKNLDCLSSNKGAIYVSGSGPNPPFEYSINNTAFQTSSSFQNLDAGTYTIKIKDSKGCIKDKTVVVSQGNTDWLYLPNKPSYVRVGDLDISGDKITVEAIFTRTSPWNGVDIFQGDLVSKHKESTDCNYLLRPSSAEITTTNGYYKTPTICPIELNKTYHVAMVYDGSILKFYRNGFLMSQIVASGNLIQNDWQTQIGLYFDQVTQEQFVGYVKEARIWNIARTQDEIKTYMSQPLPSPQTTVGLLAYYTFNDLKNKQGNATWDGTLGGNASIQQTNPNCNFIVDSCNIIPKPPVIVRAQFTAPDTACVNTPVNINNTSTNASSYFWNFCVADINKQPTGVSLGNIGGKLGIPVFMDYVYENGNYYGFVANNYPEGLIRLDFGNSLLNTPIATSLGNFGGVFPTNTQGIQLVRNNGNCYAFVVGGDPYDGKPSKIVKLDFGSSYTNTPIITDWGNIGNLNYPVDLYMFQDGVTWYGFTVNYRDGTITRFNFGANFNLRPSGVNLGNIGSLNQPSGICPINDNGTWRLFITNFGNNTLSRIDFGNSLLNTPTSSVNMGNLGNLLDTPRDLYIFNYCNQIVGFVINDNSGDIVRLNFSDLSSTPSVTSLGNIGDSKHAHSISKIFRVGSDLYGFLCNSYTHTVSRILFQGGCSSVDIPSSTLANPQPVTYSTPGTYNINLSVDDGLPTQSSYCKKIVVMPIPAHIPTQNISICEGDSIKVGSSVKGASYIWNTGSKKDSVFINLAGTYWVESNRYGCINRDSFEIIKKPIPEIYLDADTAICQGSSITLNSHPSGNYTYSWTPANSLSNANSQAPIASPKTFITYRVIATNDFGCKASDTININVKPVPTVQLGSNTSICKGDSLVLNAGNPGASYKWHDGAITQEYISFDSGYHYVEVIQNGCAASDTVHIAFNPSPIFSIRNDTSICKGSSIILSTVADGAYTYNWFPTNGLSHTNGSSPTATIVDTIQYIAHVTNSYNCKAKDSITIFGLKTPTVNLGNDTLICREQSILLDAQNANSSYLWNTGSTSQTYIVDAPGIYSVVVTSQNGCSASDSIGINLKHKSEFKIEPGVSMICKDEPLLIKASGGTQYDWFTNNGALNHTDSALIVKPAVATTYYIKIEDKICNYIDTLSAVVDIKPAPRISISKSNDISCSTPISELYATGGVKYEWSPATNINNNSISNPSVYPQIDTWYRVKVKGDNGCVGIDSIQVLTGFSGTGNFYIPNTFTPNYDGKNDCFGIKYWGNVTELSMDIYNRWGQKVFSTNNSSNCWNGKYNGVEQPVGVYIYYIKAKTLCGNTTKKGTITLIR